MHLKQRLSAGILLILSGLPAVAQVGEMRNNFAVGFNGGININNVSFTPTIKQGSLMGITGGVTARYISEKYFAMICGIQMELNYSQHGWKEKYEDSTDFYSRTMDYVEIPLLAHLAFGKDRGVQFFLNLGPQIGFLLNESEKYEYTGGEWNPPINVKEQYGKMAENKFDYGITVAAGLELRTKAGNFLIEGRYYFALSDFFGNAKKDYFSRSAHTAIQAKMTYLFDLSK
ncbi:MAG: PorT family protein [Mediterranea sp.]|nr:PorT family protein [Mediterranea sp.]